MCNTCGSPADCPSEKYRFQLFEEEAKRTTGRFYADFYMTSLIWTNDVGR